MSKHTPGPWQVDENAKGYDTEVAKCIVWGPKGPGYGAIAYTSPHEIPYSDGLQIADARLIAAAPDLLAALKRIFCVASVELTGRRDDVLEQARAAIAKAEGVPTEKEADRHG